MSGKHTGARHLLALAAWLVALPVATTALPAQQWRTLEARRALKPAGSADTLRVRLAYGVGKLTFGVAKEGLLYDLSVRYDAGERRVKYNYDRAERLLTVGDDSGFSNAIMIRRGHDRPDEDGTRPAMTLKVAQGIPLELSLDFSAADAVLDMSGLEVSRLSVEAAASDGRVTFGAPNRGRIPNAELSTTAAGMEIGQLGNAHADTVRARATMGRLDLDLGGEWTGSAALDLRAVMGVIVVRVPSDVGVRLNASATLGSIETPGFTARDGALYSANWASASRTVTIDGRAVLARLEVVRPE
jgi:hypothetical protein